VTAAPATPSAPIDLDLRADSKFDFQGATLTLTELKAKLADLAKTTPDQPIVVKPSDPSQARQVKKVLALCQAKFKNVTVDTSIADKAAADKAAADKAAKEKAAADKAAAAEKAAADKAAAAKAATDKAAADKAAKEQAAADKAAAIKATADKAAGDAKLPPIHLAVHADGKVDFQGATLTLDELKPKLEDIAKTTPGQPIIVERAEPTPHGSLHKVEGACKAAKLTSVTISKVEPPAKPAAPEAPAAPATPATPAPAPAPAAAANLTPINVEVRADGKVDFQGTTLSLDDLKGKLDDLAKTTPDQPIVVKRKEHLEKGQFGKVVRLCKATTLTKVTVDKTEIPGAPATPALPAPSVPAPDIKPLPPAMELPLNLKVGPDGKVEMDGATFTLDELKPKLEEAAKASPDRKVVITREPGAPPHQVVRELVAICHAAKFDNVTVLKTEPKPSAQPSFMASGGAALAPLPPSSTAASTNPAPTDSSAPLPDQPSKPKPTTPAVPVTTGPTDTVP
jgi:biopolymer transport protein ExbD